MYVQVLMRALRDFNLPKIITEDVTIIMGLIGDLFPALNVPRKRDMEFEDYVKKAVVVSPSPFSHLYKAPDADRGPTYLHMYVCTMSIRVSYRINKHKDLAPVLCCTKS